MNHMNQERERSTPAPASPRPSSRKPKVKLPVKWIALSLALVLMISAVIGVIAMLGGEPRVRSAEDAAAVLADRAEELGYANALSELTELHTATVGGDSYYRLQQNYQGIPVYGRTLVYAANERGELLSVTQNIQDVPENLDLTPAITRGQATDSIRAYLAETCPDLTWEDIPVVSLDKESLCIYDLAAPARLVYETYLGGFCILIDAHTGEVVHGYSTVNTVTATFKSTGEKINVGQMDDGTYVLKDEDTQTYVYTANGNTYFNNRAGTIDTSQLTLVTSENSIFGDSDDNISRDSMERARKYLTCFNQVRFFFREYNFDIKQKVILVYDDLMGPKMGKNAYHIPGKPKELLGINLFDKSFFEISDDVEMFGLGSVFSEEPADYIDVVAHEYTHAVTQQHINWTDSNRETIIVNEAYSDIFGELIQAQIKKEAPDWKIADVRNISNPKADDYPTVAWEDGYYDYFDFDSGKRADYGHFYSTVISHAAYKMWSGLDGIPGSAISTEDMARLWYTSILMLPSDADFGDCRTAVTLAAEHMGLTEAQQRGIAQAFDEAGIYDDRYEGEICYLVSKDFTLTVYGDDNEAFGNYRIEVEEDCGSLEMFLGGQFHSVSEEPGQHTFMDLSNNTVYVVTLTNLYNPTQTVCFDIKVERGGSDQLHLYTNFIKTAGEDPEPQPSEENPTEDVTEPTESQPIESEGTLDISGEVPFRIVRWDRSYRTEDGHSGMNYYFDYVVLESDSDGCRKINETLYQDAERFMACYAGNSVVTDPIGDPIIGSYTAESHVIYNQNGLLCIKVSTYDAMGGNTDHVDSYSMFFNLNTGEIATLADLTGIDEETLLPQLRSIAITELKSKYGSMLLDSAENTVSNMQLDEFDYYVYEGEIWIHFEKYSVTPGVCGAVNIATGLYIRGNSPEPTDNGYAD